MLTQDIAYRDGAASLKGFLAYDETAKDTPPGPAPEASPGRREAAPISGRS
jgi:hypothetical protein